ncbi:MAG: hypothetical protein IV085_13040 [Thiobacillus sp.]|nr:hypothetical protein [Thiobacillus sp.]
MSKVLLALTSVALLGLSGCADLYINKPGSAPAKAASGSAAITPEAAAALKQAQADVKMAKSKNALWTTAADALKKAEEAAAKGDSATVIKESGTASYHVRKGLAQLNYPQIKVGD